MTPGRSKACSEAAISAGSALVDGHPVGERTFIKHIASARTHASEWIEYPLRRNHYHAIHSR
jgi:hypothetical protein